MSFDNPFWISGCGLIALGLFRAGVLYVRLRQARKQEEGDAE